LLIITLKSVSKWKIFWHHLYTETNKKRTTLEATGTLGKLVSEGVWARVTLNSIPGVMAGLIKMLFTEEDTHLIEVLHHQVRYSSCRFL